MIGDELGAPGEGQIMGGRGKGGNTVDDLTVDQVCGFGPGNAGPRPGCVTSAVLCCMNLAALLQPGAMESRRGILRCCRSAVGTVQT